MFFGDLSNISINFTFLNGKTNEKINEKEIKSSKIVNCPNSF